MSETKFVLDTSIIIDGKATRMVKEGEIKAGSEIIIPVAALDELQAQASRNREEGFLGLSELTSLRTLSEENKIRFSYSGQRPSMEDIRLARNGRIDAIIRDVAKETGAVLLTADYVQALVGSAQGIAVKHLPSNEGRASTLKFEQFFDSETMSVHLKEGIVPFAKKGMPGSFTFAPVSEKIMERGDLEDISKEIAEAARVSKTSSLEISRSGASVIQLGSFRIAIARPPFSDGLEVTVVRPLVRLSLRDYNLSRKLEERLQSKAEGILIAGPPGSGKSTLASSLADYYSGLGKVVKTFESPKDLQVSKNVTQYGALEGDFEKTAEVLLLVRPDYTVFDEVRKTKDFQVFADMRLAGVGMVGVVHATDPVSAIQRFMSRMELGMVPHVVDTVIFVKSGKIERVLELHLLVKVPSGMSEPDLARPVVEVRDFETGNLEFEIYTYGEENVVIPISDTIAGQNRESRGIERLAEERVLQTIRKFDPGAEVKVLSPRRVEIRIAESEIPRVIGRGGSNIKELEQALSVGIEVKPRDLQPSTAESKEGSEIPFDYREKGNSITLLFDSKNIGKRIRVSHKGDRILESAINRKGKIALSKKSEVGRRVQKLFRSGEEPEVTTI